MRKHLLSVALFCSVATLAACAAPTSGPEVGQPGGTPSPTDVRGDAPASAVPGSAAAARRSSTRGSGSLTRVGIAALHAGARARGGLAVPGPSSTRAGGAAAACNALPDPVATGDIVVADGPVPAGLGGDIVDGTYVFTGGSYYGGAAGAPAGTVLVTVGSTVVLNAGSYDEISSIQGQTDTSSGTISFVDTTAASTSTCPDVASGSGDYTFDGATLTLYGPDSAETYALQ